MKIEKCLFFIPIELVSVNLITAFLDEKAEVKEEVKVEVEVKAKEEDEIEVKEEVEVEEEIEAEKGLCLFPTPIKLVFIRLFPYQPYHTW
ncbi:putative Pentafunctional AROM polypeptide,putative [Balamuthia mandrillaris]